MSVYSSKGKGWRYDFTLRGRRYTAAGFKTKREAKRKESKRREELLAPKPVATAEPTDTAFVELLERRLEFLEAYRSERHFTDQVYMARRWVKIWGKLDCGEITRDCIEGFLLKRRRVSAFTANKELRMLRATFNFGRKRALIGANPTEGVEFFPVERKVKRVPPPEDIEQVIAEADAESRDYLLAIRETMARVGEVNRLTWDDVDFLERVVVLYTRKKRGGHLTPRRVPMTERLSRILAHRFESRDWSKPWVFWHRFTSSKSGEVVEGPYTYRKNLMRTLCRKAGVEPFGFHALRHSGASVLDRANVPIGTIQRLLGHENRTTTELYLHSIGQAEREAMDVFERARLAPAESRFSEKVSHFSHTIH
jgi:integrase